MLNFVHKQQSRCHILLDTFNNKFVPRSEIHHRSTTAAIDLHLPNAKKTNKKNKPWIYSIIRHNLTEKGNIKRVVYCNCWQGIDVQNILYNKHVYKYRKILCFQICVKLQQFITADYSNNFYILHIMTKDVYFFRILLAIFSFFWHPGSQAFWTTVIFICNV